MLAPLLQLWSSPSQVAQERRLAVRTGIRYL